MDGYEKLIDEIDAAVFTGELLELHLHYFKSRVERWQRAIEIELAIRNQEGEDA